MPEFVKVTDTTDSNNIGIFFIGSDGNSVKRVNKFDSSNDAAKCQALDTYGDGKIKVLDALLETEPYKTLNSGNKFKLVGSPTYATLTDADCTIPEKLNDPTKMELLTILDDEVFFVGKVNDNGVEMDVIKKVPIKDIEKCNKKKDDISDLSVYTGGTADLTNVDELTNITTDCDLTKGTLYKRAMNPVFFIDKNKLDASQHPSIIKKVVDVKTLDPSCRNITKNSISKSELEVTGSEYNSYASKLNGTSTKPVPEMSGKCVDTGITMSERRSAIETLKTTIYGMVNNLPKPGGGTGGTSEGDEDDDEDDDDEGDGLGMGMGGEYETLYGKRKKMEASIENAERRMEFFDIFKRYFNIRIVFLGLFLLFLSGVVFSLFKKSGFSVRKGLSAGETLGLGAGLGAFGLGTSAPSTTSDTSSGDTTEKDGDDSEPEPEPEPESDAEPESEPESEPEQEKEPNT